MTKEQIKELRNDVFDLKHPDIAGAICNNMPEELIDIWRDEKFDNLTDDNIEDIFRAVTSTVDSWIELTREGQVQATIEGYDVDVENFIDWREDLEDFSEKWEDE